MEQIINFIVVIITQDFINVIHHILLIMLYLKFIVQTFIHGIIQVLMNYIKFMMVQQLLIHILKKMLQLILIIL